MTLRQFVLNKEMMIERKISTLDIQRWLFPLAILLLASTIPLGTVSMGVATFAFLLLIAAFALRSKRALHIPLAISGMTLDVSLVLFLEMNRSAIDTVIQLQLSPWQLGHVIASTIAIVLYIPVFVLGSIRWRSQKPAQWVLTWHKRLAYMALSFRTVGYFLMFSMLQ